MPDSARRTVTLKLVGGLPTREIAKSISGEGAKSHNGSFGAKRTLNDVGAAWISRAGTARLIPDGERHALEVGDCLRMHQDRCGLVVERSAARRTREPPAGVIRPGPRPKSLVAQWLAWVCPNASRDASR